MNFIHEFLSEKVLQALGWTFIHSLWQGAVIALILGFMLPGLKKRAANVRYALAVGSLAALFALSATTFVRYYTNSPVSDNSVVAITAPVNDEESSFANGLDTAPLEGASSEASGIEGIIKEFAGYFTHHFPMVVTLWFLGMILFLVKMLGGLIYSERIKFVGITPFPKSWNKNISELKAKMNINRPVKLVQSCLARVPMVIGYIKPVVLIPLGALSGIPRDQMEAIIAHELAHIRRNDFLVNIFQSIIESIFFYHPAVWWISGTIRKEREHCCDDLAVSVCEESVVYAKALANLQERSYATPFYAVALAKRRYSLLSRIKRLNRKPVPNANPAEKWITLAVMILIIAFLSVSFKITGSNSASAAVNPLQEMTFGFGLTHADDMPQSPLTALQDTLKKQGTSTINTRFFDVSDQKEKEVKMVLEGGMVTELYIDGEKVPEEEMDQYQELIDNTLAELKEAEAELEKAEEELKEAERSLKEIDSERIDQELETAREELERAMQEFKEQDWANVKQEMEQALQQIRESMEKIEFPDFEEKFQQMQVEIEQYRHDFDTSKINKELQQNLREIEKSMREFNRQFSQEMREQLEETRIAIRESLEEIQRIQGMEYEERMESQERERLRQREDFDAQRSDQEKEIRREHELQRQLMEQERQKQERERQVDETRRMHEREAMERERMHEREENKAIRAIEEQLVIDGFYSEGEPVDFELSANDLRINGKKQPKELFEKYKKLYEQQGGSIPQTATVTIKK